MARPQVTITLGRSGQKVVKESWGDSGGSFANASVASGRKRSFTESASVACGSKRSFTESSASIVDRAFSFNKRMREDTSIRSYGYSSHMDATESCLGPTDLRLKLIGRRISRHKELKNGKCKRMELHEKVSRDPMSLESPDQGLLRSVLPSRVAANATELDSVKGYSASWNSNAVGSRSTCLLPKPTDGFVNPRRSTDELPQVSLRRPVDASRTGNVFPRDPLHSPRVPMAITSRHPMNSYNPVTALAPTTGGISRAPHPGSRPLTVNSLLHSLGLGKYIVNFQAEEIDMAVLKQMDDNDLKELGIPMGPRKKILLALHARTKHATIQAHHSYVP